MEYEIKNTRIQALLGELARLLKGRMPDDWGFVLMMFNFGENTKPGSGMFYISSAERDDVIKVMQEWIDKQKGAAR